MWDKLCKSQEDTIRTSSLNPMEVNPPLSVRIAQTASGNIHTTKPLIPSKRRDAIAEGKIAVVGMSYEPPMTKAVPGPSASHVPAYNLTFHGVDEGNVVGNTRPAPPKVALPRRAAFFSGENSSSQGDELAPP